MANVGDTFTENGIEYEVVSVEAVEILSADEVADLLAPTIDTLPEDDFAEGRLYDFLCR